MPLLEMAIGRVILRLASLESPHSKGCAMRRLSVFCLAMLAVLTCGNIPVEETNTQSVTTALDGEWKCVLVKSNGKLDDLPESQFLIIKKGEARGYWKGDLFLRRNRPAGEFAAKLPGSSPRACRIPALFTLEGDLLTVCENPAAKANWDRIKVVDHDAPKFRLYSFKRVTPP
jgi:hypothetical protein